MQRHVLSFLGSLLIAGVTFAQPPARKTRPAPVPTNPLTYLDQYSDSYYPHTTFPKLTTPQWIGEPGVDAVVTLGIDDMRDTAKYEAYIRPILERLKQIDGRAALSIMPCKVAPDDPQLQSWLDEGVSIETHTTDHPCPCLQGGDFAKAKATYDSCVDTMFSIPGNHPVAFRFPCMDSLNTPSPRAFAEIINQKTPAGNFLQASTSVVCVLNSSDPQLPKSLTLNTDGGERFERYIPFPSFVNKIQNYPYPYPIGKLCWEFPCTIPDDWQGQNIQQPTNPRTVDDMLAAIEATVIKKGIANIVFHPYEWIRNDQMASLVDRVDRKFGKRVKFLTFKECVQRLTDNLLLGQSIRATDGGDNGVRLLDLNDDGFLDVLIGNEKLQIARVWQPKTKTWKDLPHDILITSAPNGPQVAQQDTAGTNPDPTPANRIDHGVRFGKDGAGNTIAFVNNDDAQATYVFTESKVKQTPLPAALAKIKTTVNGIDQGVRLRDINGDGISEILVGNPSMKSILHRTDKGDWQKLTDLPFAIVTEDGGDNAVRFVDFDGDRYDDIIVSNGHESAICLYDPSQDAFANPAESSVDIPLIVRDGTNNGVWFAEGHLWVQNEDTHRMPDGVDRRSYAELLGKTQPNPRSPELSLDSIRLRPGFTIQQVAAEPLVMDPVAIDFGPDGKLWVVEMADYPLGMDDKGKPGGRVRYLTDNDGDGIYDQSTLFLDNIPFPTGVIAWKDGVIVSAAPTIFFAADRDGDGKAEVREELYRGFTQGNQQHLVNGFERGLDNWLYLANGDSGGVVKSVKTNKEIDIRGQDLRIRPGDGSLDAQAGRTQFGRHRDDHGNWFGCSNPLPLRHYVLADHYMRRNIHVAPPSASNDIARVDNTQVFPISRILSHWSGYKPPAPGTGHKFTSACSTSIYRDVLLGEDFADNTFTCEPVHNVVHRRKLIRDGVTFRSERPADESDREFLASTDSWFRPATVTTGPDGAIWVVDMYRLVLEHPEWIDDKREKELFLRSGHDRGRIYRVFPSDAAPRQIPKLSESTTDELIQQLASPNGRTRDLAQTLLIDQHDPAATPKLRNMAAKSPSGLGRLHALCTLDGLGLIQTDDLETALNDAHATVRRHAIRLCEPFVSNDNQTATEMLIAMEECIADEPQVRLQLAYSLGVCKSLLATRMLEKLAAADLDDTYLRGAVMSSLHDENFADFFEAVFRHQGLADQYGSTLIDMAARLGRVELVKKSFVELMDKFDAKNPSEVDFLKLAAFFRLNQQNGELLGISAKSERKKIVYDSWWLVRSPRFTAAHRAAVIDLAAPFFLDAPSFTDDLHACLSAKEPTQVQLAAAKVIVAKTPHTIFQHFPEFSPLIRGEVIELLLAREKTALLLAQRIEEGEVYRSEISLQARKRLTEHPSEKVRKIAQTLWHDSPTTGVKSILARYADSSAKRGDVTEGLKIFNTQCAACHKVRGTGFAVGPDLSAIKNRSPEAMLTAILDPGAAVEDKFRSYNLLTDDGTVHTGFVARETGTSLTLRMQQGKEVTLLRDEIEQMTATGKSLMPEGLEKVISPEDMNHLLAFLAEIR
ncbi:PVC-type heme-binding CxxCH protein [Planctomycetes bacterium K23_9]|uniref:Cytochrome c n=1 Tax=Stieleria marina TaxID=1930275 RepID=A0A517NYB4_9BACT|nr:Cytochrome c [Planctomycetes bacterium K23_9]